MQTRNYAAQMLLVGFCKHWKMATVYAAIGANGKEVDAIHSLAEFMPTNAYQWHTPVRAYIAAQWPKLSEWLIANEADTKKLLTVIPQIEKLKFKDGVWASKLSADDIKTEAYQRRKDRAALSAHKLSMEHQRSNQRSAWNVCKA